MKTLLHTPRLGDDSSFSALRSLFGAAGFTESELCRRLGVASLAEVIRRPPQPEPGDARDANDLLISLFIHGEYARLAVISSILPARDLEAMEDLGLLVTDPAKPDLRYASAAVYPLRDVYLASDRWANPDASGFDPPADIVYPAVTPNTLRFLGALPEDRCDSLLELCSGSGVAALAGARSYAGHAWAVDITGRSTHFAQFNRRLNGLVNATILQGDLYEPVAGMMFDRIVAHPPYSPAKSPRFIFQDTAEDGEYVTRRIIEGLPEHLTPGGRFYCLTMGADREGQDFEARLRGWLGAREKEFDVLVTIIEMRSPDQLAADFLLKGQIGHGEFLDRKRTYASGGAEDFLYCHLAIQRAANERATFSVRRLASPKTRREGMEWLLRLETALATPGGGPDLGSMKPVAVDGVELSAVYQLNGGRITPTSFTIEVDYPLYGMLGVEPWVGGLLVACDGTRSGAQLYEHCLQHKLISPDTPLEGFLKLMRALLTGGFLNVEGFRQPEAAG